MYVRDAGVWRAVKPDGLYVRDAGTWKQVKEGYVRDAGTWKQFHQRSDPLTFVVYPDWSQGFMYSSGLQCVGSILSGVRDDDLIQGYWDVSQSSPSGTWSHVQSVAHFGDISAQIDERPIVKAATLRLTLKVGYGGDPKNTNVVLGFSNTAASKPADWNHTDTNKGVQDTGDLFTAEGQTKTITLNSAMRAALQAGSYGINVHDTSHSTSEAGKRATRAIFEGASAPTAVRPMLTLTLDFV
jgi:hypothetical protein